MTEEIEQVADQNTAQKNDQQAQSKETDKDYNFAQMRKQMKERDDYIASLKKEMDSLREEVYSKNKPKEEEIELDDDDFLTKKAALKYAEQIAEKKIKEQMSQLEQQNFKQRARETYKDFDDVVTPENLHALETEWPELASLIADSKDNYKMACGAYKAIKSMKKGGNPQAEIEKNQKAMEKNLKEPLSVAAVDRRPIAQATRLSDKDYQELWAEMQHYASKVK